MALDHRALAVQARGLAVGHPHAAHLQFGGFGDEVPQGFAGLFHRHAVQVEAALEWNLPQLQLAQLAFLRAIAAPHQLVFGAYVDDELVGHAIDDQGLVTAHGRRLAQAGQLLAVGLGLADVGTVVADRLYAAHFGLEQGKIVVLHDASTWAA
ncbi:hypothetical protein D9M71_427450 [compost metagenome]